MLRIGDSSATIRCFELRFELLKIRVNEEANLDSKHRIYIRMKGWTNASNQRFECNDSMIRIIEDASELRFESLKIQMNEESNLDSKHRIYFE